MLFKLNFNRRSCSKPCFCIQKLRTLFASLLGILPTILKYGKAKKRYRIAKIDSYKF